MIQSANAMYTINSTGWDGDGPKWSAHVLCTIIGDDREHGWFAQGYTEWQAINELQIQMEAVK